MIAFDNNSYIIKFSKDVEDECTKSKIIFERDPNINFYFSSMIKYDDNYIYIRLYWEQPIEKLFNNGAFNFSRRTIRTWLHSTIISYTI